MVDSDNEDVILQQIQKNNLHFKALLDLVPAHSYFSREDKLEILGTILDEDEKQDGQKRKNKRFKENPFTTMTVTEIIELREKGGLAAVAAAAKKKFQPANLGAKQNKEKTATIEEKHKGKKISRQSKGNKKKGKELKHRGVRIEELSKEWNRKLEDIKAKLNSGNALASQEVKKLKRQQRKIKNKLINRTKTIKEQKPVVVIEKTAPKKKQIAKENGEEAKPKFDFSISSNDNSSKSSNFRGRDYKRLLEKVEKRQEKVEKLKESDLEAGKKLEQKFQWQAAMFKAKGEKVKDDAALLKKAVKRKDKIKEKKKKKWGDRVKTVDDLKQKRQLKRQTNINKRKQDKKDNKRKKLIKKGRILPGF